MTTDKHGSSWRYIVTIGKQPKQRCDKCGRVHWASRVRLTVCPRKGCGGHMVDVGLDRRQEFKSGYPTEAAAQSAGRAAAVAIETGTHVADDGLTVAEFFEGDWFPALRVSSLQPSTIRTYEMCMRLYVIGRIGSMPLQRLDKAAISRLYTSLRTDGRRDGEGLGASLVHTTAVVLHKALDDGVELGYLARNPAADLSQPSGRRPEMKTWRADEVGRFLDATTDTRPYPLWATLLETGMRRGEACGLRWSDVNIEAATATIRRSLTSQAVTAPPKTQRGFRPASLPRVLCEDLMTWQNTTQAADKAAQPDSKWWGLDYVFTQPDGRPYSPDTVSKWFVDAQAATGMSRIRLHDMRHTYITLALELGENPEVVARQVGEDVAILLATYSHVRPQVATQAAERIAGSIPRARCFH